MSADNGIYILPIKKENEKIVYKVAHVFAIDNLDYYIKKGNKQELDEYINKVWGKSKECTTKLEALSLAGKMEEKIPYVEYGIRTLNYTHED